MSIFLLAAAMLHPTALQAETAFEHDAMTIGQWTAFRKWAAADALMFVPQPTNAQAWLKGRKDPPQTVRWTAALSFVACDGSFAVNTGPSYRDGGRRQGEFTTVWRRQGDSWRWIYDAGDEPAVRRPWNELPREQVAACTGTPGELAEAQAPPGSAAATGSSPDGTLRWSWTVTPSGERTFRAFLWNGTAYDQVVADRAAAQ